MVLAVLAGPCGAVAAATRPALVLHIDDRAQVPPHELAAAMIEVKRTFLAVGVEIVWTEGRFQTSVTRANTDPGQSRHMFVMLVNNGEESAQGCALGFAAARISVAYVFHNRVVDTSRRRSVDMRVVLGRVIAHEIGHLLLPRNSHSRYGIMRADLDLGFVNPNRFTDEQAWTIRAGVGRLAME
jgi:hypothetical protein